MTVNINDVPRPRISADLILGAVSVGTHRVTSAWIHPADLPSINLERMREMLGVSAILPASNVERGFIYVNTRLARR